MVLFLQQLDITALASPLLRHEVEDVQSIEEPALQRRQDQTVTITGINTFGVQPRLEIRQLEQNTDQWNIFLLGMQRFQKTNQSDLISYYQIAGIHGRPYQPWDGVPSAPGVEGPGYCAHVSNLFLAWHRPYLALFEQTLYQHIVAVVNEFPAGAQRQRYASAALSWRFPYWDWAALPTDGGSAYPASMQSPTINVTTPNGTATIHNPLYSYKFHPVSQQDFYFNPVSLLDGALEQSQVLTSISSQRGTRLSGFQQAGPRMPRARTICLSQCSITIESRFKTVFTTCSLTMTTLLNSATKHG
jgi:tyrosinase